MEKEELRIAVCDDSQEELLQIQEAVINTLDKLERSVSPVFRLYADSRKLYADGEKEKESFQMVFLDIEMPGMDGFHLAEKLHLQMPQTALFFVSSHENLVFDSQLYTPLWFVRKGMLKKDMFRALSRYFTATESRRISYKVKSGFGHRELYLKEILYVECVGHELDFVTVSGLHLKVYGSLKAVEEDLSSCGFLRIHKSFLVNQSYVESVEKKDVVLKNGIIVEMGRDRRRDVEAAMLRYRKDKGGEYGI